MEIVPKHYMGRVQNTFMFLGTGLQIVLGGLVGMVSHNIALAAGFAIVGTVYLAACVTAVLPAETPVAVQVSATMD